MNWRRVVVVMGMAGCGLLHGQSYTLTARSTYSQFLVLSPDKPQAEILFPVDDMTSMTVSALASRKSIELTLTDPGGAVRSQDLEYAPEEIPGRSLVYRISKPAIGKWRLSAREPKAFSGVETVILQVRFASNVIAALPGLPGGSTAAGQPVRFTLVVAYESGGLGPSAGIQVNARATGPDGGVVLQFHDDGADGDAQANDGAWVAAYTPLKAGSYIVAATVTGTRKGAAFARTASNSFDFAAPCGKLGAPVDSSAVDTDGDGAGDALELKFPVNADLAGRFEVQARLTGANGVSVAAAGRGDLEAGSQSLTLRLGAADLRTAGDGPYQIARATLSCVTDAGTTKSDERTDLGVTAAFAAATAATRDPLAPTAVNTEKLVDDDGNGRADTLVVGIGLRVAEAGDFSWTAQLVDAAGTVIDTASASGALAAGAATAELRFDGTKIGKNGLVGPFEVRQFEIRGVPGSLFLELAGITKAHNAYQFEGGPQPPGLSVDPTALDFGSVTGGQTKDLNLTIANAATSAASIAALVFSNGRFSAPTVTLPLSVPGGGSRTIAIRFAPTSAGEQTGTLTAAGLTVPLRGTGVAAACSYSLSTASADVAAAGGSGSIGVTAAAGCAWTAVSNASWITLTGGAPGSGNGTVSYAVAANTGAARTGTLSVAGQKFTVNQAAAGGTGGLPSRPAGAAVDSTNALSTSLMGLYLLNEGSGTTVKNLVNGQMAAFAGGAPPTWNAADPSVVFQGGGSLNSYINAGTDASFDRLPTSAITIVAKVWVNKLEAGGICEKNDLNQADGILFGWDANGSLRFTLERAGTNLRATTNTAAVQVGKWQQVALTWDGTVATAAAVRIYVDGVSQTISGGSDGSGGIGYAGATNQPFRIGNASFDPMAGALNGKMAYLAVYRGRILTAAELNQFDARLPVSGGTAACTYSISPISAQPGAAGSSGTVEVTAGSGCSWTAVSQASWITITSAASGAGSGMVGYSVAANTGAARSGNIAVAGQTFTVNQAAAGGTTGLPSRPAGAAVDSANALSTSLVGLYLMNESSGATVKNLVNGQTAVFAGAAPPGWNTAEPSVIFQGGGSLNSFVNAGTDAGFDRLPTSTITIVAKVWVNKLEAAGICEKNDGNQADGILFGWATSGSLRLTVERPGSDLRVVSATSAVKAGKWQQIALTWDGTAGNVAAAHFYVDGALQSVSDGSEGSGTIGYAGATNQPFRIGNASFDPMAGALNGRMAYFAVYRGRILTPAELNQLDARLPITEGK